MSYGKFTVKYGGLLPGSMPFRAEQDHDEEHVASRRRLHCKRYDNCLSYAAEQAWPGFHCAACSVEEPDGREEWLRDLDGLARFLRALDIGH